MAEEAVIGAAIDEAVKVIVPPIKRQFNYLCCFTSNINKLKHEAEELDVAERGIQMQVDTDVNAGRVIHPQVDKWLADSKKIKDEKTATLDQVTNVGSVCLNLRARFCLSKRATKAAERMKELRDECRKFGDVSLPGPPAATKPIQLGNTYEFESRKQIEEDIMTVLKDGDVSMIGICGMGGLGKTTMAKRIMNRVLKDEVFKEAVFAVVSQSVDKPKIQLDIGGQLDLKLQDEPSETVRIQKLHERLSSLKRTLLVLDDVWQGVELEEFGIPRGSKGCTILITSRNRDTLSKMDVQKEFGMKILSKEEARFLFREKAGTCMDDDDELKSTAEEIVKECEGLPLALTAVGDALKGEKGPSSWRDALRQLRQCDPDIPPHIEKIYNPLKLSYDLLKSKHAKFLFLLCCLYPEDANIDVEVLTYFGMGLGIFEGIGNLEEVRDRVFVSITLLISRSLLMDSESRNHVRMHDVVRDVCIYIAKQEGYVGGNDCYWISSFQMFEERSNLRIGMRLPNLRLLFWSGGRKYNSEGEAFKPDKAFFEGISDLYVVCIQRYGSLTSRPPAQSLKNLKSLILDSCYKVETISAVAEFVHLEILICRNCHLVKELPLEMKRLNRLKLLDLTRCKNLQRIGPGIISSLFRLEELKMLESFNRWESEDREERENAGLRELEALTNLRCLEIEVENHALAAEKMHLSSKIKRFHIRMGTSGGGELEFDDDSYNKRLVLELKGDEPCLGHSIEMRLLRDTEYLHLSGNGANSVDLAKCQSIRWLELTECETMKNIITTSMVDDGIVVLASLEHMCLGDLPKLEGICDGPISSNSFHNLKELNFFNFGALKQLWKGAPPHFTNLSSINIDRCHHLCNLGQLSITEKGCFPQLEKLVIKNCEMMEQVFLWNKEGESKNNHCITKVFPKLKEVKLSSLPNLATFYQGTGCFEFPLLTKFSIRECPKWKSMGSNHNTGGSNADIDDDSWHLFCQPKKVSFGKLKKLSLSDQWNPFCGHEISSSLLNGLEVLRLHKLHGSRSLFSSAVAGNLVNLHRLEINQCEEMLKVIEDKKEDDEQEKGQIPLILFPKLEFLKLEHLPKLVSFCEWKCDIKLPSLREVRIWGCHYMVNLSLRLLAAPNFEDFTTDANYRIQTEVSSANLDELILDHQLNPFCGHEICSSLLNGLKVLTLHRLYGSGSLFSSAIAGNLVNLQRLEINQCDEILKVIEDKKEDEEEEKGEMSLILFPKLEKLKLENLPKLVSLFSSTVARNLVNLQSLEISECEEMLKVIEDKKEDDEQEKGQMTHILFPKLEYLELEKLPKLVSFCEWKCDIKLPSLRKVCLSRCPDMVNLSFGLLAAPNLENFTTDADYNIQTEVSFDSLKKLITENSEKPFYGHNFFISIFNGLKQLHVFEGSMSSLFTHSIARRLDGLEVLSIQDCSEMMEVIEDDGNEEKVGSGGERSLLFPKLKLLQLRHLPKLHCFCEWKCDIELLSLRDVIFYYCPVLRNFTMGSKAAAPNLKYVEIEYEHIDIDGGKKDLNSVLQQYMEKREEKRMEMEEERKKMEEEHEEEEKEEEEINGEIEEEEPQN